MRNTLKKVSFSSILGALMLAASPSTAAEPTLGELKILLDSIDKRLDALEKPRRNSDGNILLKEPIGGEEIVTPGVTVHDMKKMQEEIVMLKKRVMELESRPVRIVRDESKLIRDPAVADPTRLAKVKFRNDWIEEVSILVNGISYEILPGFERTISVPAGAFTYQVLDLQRRPQTRILEADKTWTVQINTRN